MSEDYQYLLTIVDSFMRYVQAIPLKDATADSVCSGFLPGWVSFIGVPVYLQSDHGSCFLSQKFQALRCWVYNICLEVLINLQRKV